MDGPTGNTAIAGTLTTENTLTINGNTVVGKEFFTITNGGPSYQSDGTTIAVPFRKTLEVDTATGDLTINGGNFKIFGNDGTTPRLTLDNSSGDFRVYGSFSATGDGTSRFGGAVQIGQAFGVTDPNDPNFVHRDSADLTINGGDLTINSDGDKIFSVENDGAVNIAGISNYFSQTGGRKWEYKDGFEVILESNVNYFINVTQNTIAKLPANPLIGDMVRIIDIGGTLTYNRSLVVRAATGQRVQKSTENTGLVMLSGVGQDKLTGYNGGELIVQTPYAGFALVYAGTTDPDGNPAVPGGQDGWYLIEV